MSILFEHVTAVTMDPAADLSGEVGYVPLTYLAQFFGSELVHVQGIFPGFLLKMRYCGFGVFYLGACRHGFGTRNEGHHLVGLFFR